MNEDQFKEWASALPPGRKEIDEFRAAFGYPPLPAFDGRVFDQWDIKLDALREELHASIDRRFRQHDTIQHYKEFGELIWDGRNIIPMRRHHLQVKE